MRGENPNAEAYVRLVSVVISDWNTTLERHDDYATAYATREKTLVMWRSFESAVARTIPHYAESVGVDLGCWLGFPSLAMRLLGARRVVGVDPVMEHIEAARRWLANFQIQGLEFVWAEEMRVPMPGESVDWVVINQVLCNALPESFDASLREAFRILRRGGCLILSDSNNPHCPQTIERLRTTYRKLELGEGSPSKPAGPTYLDRAQYIRECAPDLGEEAVTALACGTCYQWGPRIQASIKRFKDAGLLPQSAFEDRIDRTPCHPRSGVAHGNVTDPHALKRILEALGFHAQITVQPGWEKQTEDKLARDLATSQGFYIYARKAAKDWR